MFTLKGDNVVIMNLKEYNEQREEVQMLRARIVELEEAVTLAPNLRGDEPIVKIDLKVVKDRLERLLSASDFASDWRMPDNDSWKLQWHTYVFEKKNEEDNEL